MSRTTDSQEPSSAAVSHSPAALRPRAGLLRSPDSRLLIHVGRAGQCRGVDLGETDEVLLDGNLVDGNLHRGQRAAGRPTTGRCLMAMMVGAP